MILMLKLIVVRMIKIECVRWKRRGNISIQVRQSDESDLDMNPVERLTWRRERRTATM